MKQIQTLTKTLTVLTVTALFALPLLSCGTRSGRITAQNEGEEYLSSLTKADTVSLLLIADSCMTLLTNGEYEKALAGVGYVDGETIEAMTPEMIARTAMSFKNLGVHGFERSGIELVLPDQNTISYRLKIGGPSSVPEPAEGTATSTVGEHGRTTSCPSTSSGTATSTSSGAITPTTGFAFNAYRINGHWYLTLKQ